MIGLIGGGILLILIIFIVVVVKVCKKKRGRRAYRGLNNIPVVEPFSLDEEENGRDRDDGIAMVRT